MKKFDHSSRWAGWARQLGFIALLFTLLAAPKAALAHPADVYLQASYLTVLPTQIVVELKLSPAILVAPELLTTLDPNGDEQIEEAEWQAYVDQIVPQLALQVNGQPLLLTVTELETMPYLNIQAGYGEIRITLAADLAAVTSNFTTGTHQIYYKNNFAPTGVAYQVNAFVDQTGAGEPTITLGKQNRDELQQSIAVDYTIGPVATTAADISVATTSSTSVAATFALPEGAAGQGEQLLTYLYAPTSSPWALLLGLALAVVLGGLHALTPGHGKTLVAAYLVGSRGTVRHAIALGGIVTFTHTASVIVIGLLALFASQYMVPSVLTPLLQTLSGLLVVYLGVRLVWQRWLVFRSDQGHRHPHHHDHDHEHEHHHEHHHGDGHVHTHLPPVDGLNLRNLVAMGVSGGLVPCPEALGIMVIAIGLNRILLGLGLIVSFSFGLAAVLIAIGILLVRSRALLERVGGFGGRWSNALPLASAVIVTVLGIGITFGAVATYWG
ncbi:MAG: hypothetical protein R3E79_29680 [Caldilineaceae bacterium]